MAISYPLTIQTPTLSGMVIGPLTRRQTEVALWVGEGKTDPETACIIGCSARTVRQHVINAMAALDVHTRAQLICRLCTTGVVVGKSLALVLICTLFTGAVGLSGNADQPFRLRAGARLTTRINRPLNVHGGA